MQNIGGLPCLLSGASPSKSRIVLLHGRGASAEDLFSLSDNLPDRSQGIFPQAPLPFPPEHPFGFAWFNSGGANIVNEIQSSAALITALLDKLVQGDPKRAASTILGGFSQGGVMTLEVGLKYRPRLAGLIVMSGRLIDEERSFEGFTDAPPPVCVVHGTHDDVLPIANGRKINETLMRRGVDVRYHEHEMGHEISGASFSYVRSFIDAVLS